MIWTRWRRAAGPFERPARALTPMAGFVSEEPPSWNTRASRRMAEPRSGLRRRAGRAGGRRHELRAGARRAREDRPATSSAASSSSMRRSQAYERGTALKEHCERKLKEAEPGSSGSRWARTAALAAEPTGARLERRPWRRSAGAWQRSPTRSRSSSTDCCRRRSGRRPGCMRPCATPSWAAASGCGRSWCWPVPRCSPCRRARALRVGAAVELIHGYSLVHDDLPAMDDAT